MSPEGLIYPGLAFGLMVLGTCVGVACGMMLGYERAHKEFAKDDEADSSKS